MQWQFQYSGYVWPMLASAVFLWMLAAYTWRHRAAPGAVPLSASMVLIGLWALLAALGALSADRSTELFWFRLKNIVSNPPAVTALCFALGYAGLGGWITRRRLAILLAPSAAIVPLMFYDDSRILWTPYWPGETIHRTLAPVGLAMNLYDMGLLLTATAVIASLLVRSPLHRASTSLILLGHLGMLAVIPLEAVPIQLPDTPLDLTVLSADFAFTMYAIALFRFRLLDVVPVARTTVLEQMADGMLVLDAEGRVADLNPAAQELLGTPRSRVLGQDGALALAAFPDLARLASDTTPAQVDVLLGTSGTQRWYQVRGEPLTDRRGFRLGRLMLFRDLTELKRTQQQMLDQQLALAALQERGRLARELHDSLGQVFAFMNAQGQTVRRLLARGDVSTADGYVARMVEAAREADTDIRESILGLRVSLGEQGLFSALAGYLERYERNYGIHTELSRPETLCDGALEPAVEVQILRILQEALANARKHAHARSVRVAFTVEDGSAQVSIQDDGQGLGPEQWSPESGHGYGLRFMRERAEEIGGTLVVRSEPGQGTEVRATVPVRPSPPRAVTTTGSSPESEAVSARASG